MATASKTVSLRDKYKATPLDVLKQSAADEDQMIGSQRGDGGYHDIDDGVNTFRIYPKKPDDKKYYHVRVQHWITIEDEDGGDPKRRSVYNARIHGGYKHDVIEEYVKTAPNHIKELQIDDEDKAKKTKSLTDWKQGLQASTDWVVWADKITRVDGETQYSLKPLALKKTVRDDLNSEAMTEDPEETITVDPYTDVDTGKRILITKEKKKEGKKEKTYYKTKISKESPLSDEQLEEFENKKSLTEMFSNVYSKADFDMAINGLKYFDEFHEIGLFEEQSWLDKVAEMKKEVAKGVAKGGSSDEETEEDKPKAKTTTVNKGKDKPKAVPVDEEPEIGEEPEPEAEEPEDEPEAEIAGDEFDDMNRDDLRRYIVKNELGFQTFKSWSDDDIREKIRKVLGKTAEPEAEEPESEVEKPKSKTSLDDVKARIMAQKGKK